MIYNRRKILTNSAIFTIVLLSIAYFFVVIFTIWNQPDLYQWDFNVYYHGATNYSKGLNPYSIDNTTKSVGPTNNLNYVYPPITLVLFKYFGHYDYTTAYRIFLILKIIAFSFLLILWSKYFDKGDNYLLYLLCLLGFNATVLNDLLAGNISMFEQLILWIGFFALLKKKIILFGICILVTAIFKIIPLLFLFLILIQKDKNKYSYFFLFSTLFFVITIAGYLADPELFRGFIRNTSLMVDTGIVNPCNLALLTDIRIGFNKYLENFFPPWSTIVAYILLTSIILKYSFKSLKDLLCTPVNDKEILVIYLVITVYALVVPRFKDYSYIIMIMPAFYIIRKIKWDKTYLLLLGLLLLSGGRFIKLPILDLINSRFWGYYPLVLAYLIWGMYLFYISELCKANSTISS